MKKCILGLILILASFSLFAQRQLADPTVGLGIRAGFSFTNYALSGSGAQGLSASGRNTYYGTLLANIHLYKILYVQPSVSLLEKGAKVSDLAGVVREYAPLHVEAPINLVVFLPFAKGKVFAGAGPYWAFPVGGKLQTTNLNDVDLKFGPEINDHLKTTDFGFNFLLGYQIKAGLSINGGYGMGIKDVQPNKSTDLGYKNQVWYVGLGYTY